MTVTAVELILTKSEQQFPSNPEGPSDRQLLSLDFILHRAWRVLKSGGRVCFEDGPCGEPEIAAIHAAVRKEMDRRRYNHIQNDGLSEPTEKKIEKGLLDKKNPQEFPNLVLNEDGAVDFVRKRKTV